jgi:hypothetical protein
MLPSFQATNEDRELKYCIGLLVLGAHLNIGRTLISLESSGFNDSLLLRFERETLCLLPI